MKKLLYSYLYAHILYFASLLAVEGPMIPYYIRNAGTDQITISIFNKDNAKIICKGVLKHLDDHIKLLLPLSPRGIIIHASNVPGRVTATQVISGHSLNITIGRTPANYPIIEWQELSKYWPSPEN